MLTYEDLIQSYPSLEERLGADLFTYLNRLIKRRIDYMTFNRINYNDKQLSKDIDDLIADIIYSLIAEGYFKDKDKQEVSTDKEIKSEAVGSYKVEYFVGSSSSDAVKEAGANAYITQAIKEALAHTGLLFRGYYENEYQG